MTWQQRPKRCARPPRMPMSRRSGGRAEAESVVSASLDHAAGLHDDRAITLAHGAHHLLDADASAESWIRWAKAKAIAAGAVVIDGQVHGHAPSRGRGPRSPPVTALIQPYGAHPVGPTRCSPGAPWPTTSTAGACRPRPLVVQRPRRTLLCHQDQSAGDRGTSLRDVRDLCALYGVTESASAELMSLARRACEQGWWTQYEDLELDPYSGRADSNVDYQLRDASHACAATDRRLRTRHH